MEATFLNWFRSNQKAMIAGLLGVSASACTLASLQTIPADHLGIVRNRSGGIRTHVFHSTEVAMVIPFWEHVILIRENPVKKRFIKEFKTADNKEVEARLMVSIQPPAHWMPEIFYKFGKDYGRTFLEREATIDFEEVCKKYTAKDLLESGSDSDAVSEMKLRLQDAAAFHRLQIAEASISFIDPTADIDEY